MGKIKISKEEYSKIVDLYKNGVSKTEIANMYNVCRDTICKILKTNNVDRYVKINVGEYENIASMYKRGITQQELADKYGVSTATIVRVLKDFEIDWKSRKGLTIPKSEYETIVNMYTSGMTQAEIAAIYNCSASSISSILHKFDVLIRLGGSKNAMADISQWAKMYEDGMLLSEIADEFGTTGATVSKLLKKNGYNVDRFTYHFDECYFDNIDSQEKAYILGILWADGCNARSKNSIILQLQEKDRELLEAINVLTKNERPLRKQELSKYNPKWQDCYKITWQSKHLSELFESYGMVQKKSLVLEFPRWLTDDLYSHFIRGYFDGDGCISLMKINKNRSAYVGMVGTRMFLDEVAKIIRDQVGINVHIKRDERANDPICNLRCNTREDVLKLLNWLYNDANIYMKRKYDKYQQFLNNINNSCCV